MNTYGKLYGKFERDFMGCTTTGVLVQSIVGAIAAMYVLMHGTTPMQMIQLFFVVGSCMMYNGSVLSQQKPKVIFNILLVSITINIIIAVLNII